MVIWAIVLGLVQGLTEFLPISSSGHLVFVQKYFKLSEIGFSLDVVLHLGTLSAIIIYFWPRLIKIWHRLRQVFADKNIGRTPKEIGLVIVATLPVVLAGIFLYGSIQKIFDSPKALPFTYAVTAGLLFSVQKINRAKLPKNIAKMSYIDAFIIGCWQIIALFPGVSRSGTTYVAGRWRGLTGDSAFYFSFLMAIPAILGAFILEFGQQEWLVEPYMLVGFLSSLIFSLAGLYLLDQVIRRQKIHYFGVYCLVLSFVSYLVFW